VRLAARLRAGIPELTEVLVESDENSTLGQSRCQDFFISGIFIPVARPDDVMTQDEMAAVEARYKTIAGDGRYELFKTAQNFDGVAHRKQHGFAS